MYNLDSISLKYFFDEAYDFLLNSIVQKIQLASRYEIILNLRNIKKAKNKKLYININPKYPHICFTNETGLEKRNIIIPSKPPMFCMQLRKYLNGSKIKDFKIVEYERILELYFDYFDEIGSITKMCLSLEFMGKHSNIILYNSISKIIIGAMHNISSEKSSVREIFGGVKYIYPPKQNKLDILKTSYSTFFEIAKDNDIKKISDNFYYFSRPLLTSVMKKYSSFEDVFKYLQKIENLDENQFIKDFWGGGSSVSEAIDCYFSSEMYGEILSREKQRLKKYILGDIKKIKNFLLNKTDENKYEKYKQYADIIMMNLYNIKKNQDKFLFEGIEIDLDTNLSPSENAQKYYSIYKKQKTAHQYALKRNLEAKNKLEYYEGIIFDIDNAISYNELNEIEEELFNIGLIEKKENIKKQEIHLNKLEFMGYEIYFGKNNKQNDFLISKIASPDDLWFHVLNCPSSHVILKVKKDKTPEKEVLEYCANLVKENSKAKFSGKTSVIMTKRKNLKKPPDTHLGYVTYKNEIEIVV